jgi:putative ABC transport system substrate-binding protein
MRRAALLAALVVFGTPVAARHAEAQTQAKIPRIAFISTTSPGTSPATDAFVRGLRDLGYIEGRNIAVEWRWGRGSTARFPEFASEVARLNVDVIVAANAPAGYAAQRVTRTIPIVIPTMSDPVGDGFVASIARPGGNVTGLTFQSAELQGKRLQILKEIVPGASRTALIVDRNDRSYPRLTQQAEAAARGLGLRLYTTIPVQNPADLDVAFTALTRQGADTVLVVGGTMLYANRRQLAEHALKARLPMMCDIGEAVAEGCFVSYGAALTDLFRRAASYVDRILKGARPADLPVEQPTRFELFINARTAKALGLTIPQPVLLLVDQLIDG